MTAEDAEKALRRDASNVLKRVKQGKPISSADRKLLQSLAAGGGASDARFVRSAVELAAALEVDRRTVSRWLKEEGNPGRRPDGRYDLNAWREWKRSRKSGPKDGEIDPKDEKARQLVLQNKKLEFQISVMKREYVPSEDVEAWVGQMVSQAKRVLLGIPAALAPQVVGVSVPEAESVIRDAVNEALLQLHTRPLGDSDSDEEAES